MKFLSILLLTGAALLTSTQGATAQTGTAIRTDLTPSELSGVFSVVEKRPEFGEGGVQAWGDFLRANLQSAPMQKLIESDTTLAKTGISERVVVRFIVCEDGTLCNLEVANRNSVHPELAEEALRVMRLSPRWVPGEAAGKKVKTRFSQPIRFSME